MSVLSRIRCGDTSIFYVAKVCEQLSLPTPSMSWFSAEQLPSDFTITGNAAGRGTTWFFKYQEHELVLRHYRRGGLMAKLSDDSFIFVGSRVTRPVKELLLLAQMQDWHLPAPQPVAGCIRQSGLFWQGDLITARIEGAEDVHTILQQRKLSTMEWRHIGATIKRFHQRQVFHHDLNIHNIMLDAEGQAWLIDFDKCGIKSGKQWKQANLARLQRSLLKESAKHATYHFNQDDWRSLLNGYAGASKKA